MFWCRSRSTRPIPTACRPGSSSRRATSCACRSARARSPAWSGARGQSAARARQPAQGHRRQARRAAAQGRAAHASSTGSPNYTLAPRGMVLRMALRMGEHLGPERERIGVRLAGPPPQRMTAARDRVLALLADGMVRAKGEAAREAGVSAGVIDGLVDEGTLETLVLPPEPVARSARSGYRAARSSRRRSARRRMRCATPSPTAASRRRCSTASPAPARPRSISRRSRSASGAAGRR